MTEETNPGDKKIQLLELTALLQGHGIDLATWGSGQAKTVQHLLDELNCGEASLQFQNDELLRKISVATVDILYISPDGKRLRLKETKQVFKDQRERQRDLPQAVSEKIRISENPMDTAQRGVQEELGIEGVPNFTYVSQEANLEESTSYPGLQTLSVIYNFCIMLADEQFRPDGYKEVQTDKTTYFDWEEISTNTQI